MLTQNIIIYQLENTSAGSASVWRIFRDVHQPSCAPQ